MLSEGRKEAHRVISATSKGEAGALQYSALEKILSKENMTRALKRVEMNKGSHDILMSRIARKVKDKRIFKLSKGYWHIAKFSILTTTLTNQ